MTMRSVQDRFWSDGWVRKLNPLDRYLFLYLLTNEHTNWCGIYELELGVMAFESGLDREELQRSMLPRLSPKVIYLDGWVYVPNWTRHHSSESGTLSPTQQKGIDAAWKTVPERIRLKLKEIEDSGIPYTYPMVGVSPSASALSSSFSLGGEAKLRIERVVDEEKPIKEKKDTTYLKVFELFPERQMNWRKNTTQIDAAKNLLEEHGLEDVTEALDYYHKNTQQSYIPEILTPSDLDRKWLKLAAFSLKKYGK